MGYVYFSVGASVAIIVALMVIGTIWLRRRTRQIASSRLGETFDTFRASLALAEAPPDVLRAVYLKFQEWCTDAVAAFPVRATDDIGNIYGMMDEDLDDALMEVLAECGRKLPSKEQLRQLHPVVTVRDFVCFVAGCPQVLKHADAADGGA